jgi:hypothetical protein
MAENKGEYGEGNYKASRQYNDATKKFVESGRVDQAAHDAAPSDEVDAQQMASAEAEGRRRAKEEDPALRRDSGKDDSSDPAGTPSTDRSADQPSAPKPGHEGH